MKVFTASANIKAAPATIWAILTDAKNYPVWDPGVDRIDGTIAVGEKLTVYSKLRPHRALSAKVSEIVPGQKMIWTGAMPLGLFKGVRTFTLQPQGDRSVDVILHEEFSGPLLPLIGGLLPDLTQTFVAFVAGLKQHAEAQA